MSDHGTDAILGRAREWRTQGRGVVLATVLDTWGSAPRRPGAHMAVAGDGEFVGSVSGGCVEVAVVEEARSVLREGRPRSVEFGVADDVAWAVGLACGGRIQVRLEPVGEAGLRDVVLDEVLEARSEARPVVLVTDLASGEATVVPGGAPHPLGAEIADALRLDQARTVDAEGRTGSASAEEPRLFLRPHNPPVRIAVVGAVHLAQALVPLIRAVGYEAVVIDPRDDFTTPGRFPGVTLLRRWPREALDEMHPDARTGVVVVSHDPKFDDPALIRALDSEAFYVGALGSRRTHARRLERLREAGVPEAALDRIRAPVGLDIGARSPEEIAVSILAEIVRDLRRPPAPPAPDGAAP
jgi:xanthine dehydrogenase accessory factor